MWYRYAKSPEDELYILQVKHEGPIFKKVDALGWQPSQPTIPKHQYLMNSYYCIKWIFNFVQYFSL